MRNKKVKFDIVLLICVILLVVIGNIFVYSASKYSAQLNYGDEYFYLKKQLIGSIIGLSGLIGVSFFNIEKIKKFKYIFLCLAIILLGVVFIPGIGKNSYGANRWINLGILTIQPSEIAKFCFIIFASASLADVSKDPKKFKTMFPVLIAGVLICLLIILEPNMSITMCVGFVMVIMLFVGGSGIKNLITILIPVVLAVPLLIILEPYRLKRLSAFLDPWSSPLEEGFQLIQSYYALGSGGWFGLGFGNSRQKYLFLPFAESDFILSVIGEEMGFIFCIFLLVVYMLIIVRGFKIALNAKTRFQCYLTSGIIALIGVQTLINIAVVTGSIPPTGLPLPFISAGSTSLLVFMSAIGVVLNVDRQSMNRTIIKTKRLNK